MISPMIKAVAFLVGLGFVVAGVLVLPGDPGYGLALIGTGFVVAGFGGSLILRGLGVAVSGTVGGVLLMAGVLLSLAHP